VREAALCLWSDVGARKNIMVSAPSYVTALFALLGVICFWKGMWGLLTLLLPDKIGNDLIFVAVGLVLMVYTGAFFPQACIDTPLPQERRDAKKIMEDDI